MTTRAGTRSDLEGLGHLGEGGRDDRLHFRLILGMLWRSVRLLRPVRPHIFAILAGFTGIAVLLFPIILLMLDIFWTRVLQGEALTLAEARFLGLDPESFVRVLELDALSRHQVAQRGVLIGALATILSVPVVVGLFYYRMWILQRINQVLRIELLDRLQSLSLRFHADSRVGDAIYRLYQDSAMVTQLIEVLFLAPLFYSGRYLFSIGVVTLFDPGLALVLGLAWPPALLLSAWCSRRMRVGFRRAREANSRLTSRIQESLAGIKIIKAYGIETREQHRFEWHSALAFREAFAARNLFAVFQVLIFFFLGSAALGATAFATLETQSASALAVAAVGFASWNLGLYNAFKMQAGSATDSSRDLFRLWGRVQDVAIGLDRVFEVLDLELEIEDAPDAVPLERVRSTIRFRGVHFAYQPERPVLKGVHLDAEIGTITAIVGPTGAGKSTLMTLLLRLFDPTAGSIEIDGIDLRRFQTASVRSQISIALQENILFRDTVGGNIRFARPKARQEAVAAAARVACAEEFIEALPQRYDTLLGERGTKLSTGQRQRLSIARAVLKDTPILILDEPTASLDASTERELMCRLSDWGRNRAIFLISHRLSTVRYADRIAFLHDGKIVESGRHEELMQRMRGAYRSLLGEERAAEGAPVIGGGG